MPISLTRSGLAYTQNFDSLAGTGTSSALPGGWTITETGTNANGLYTAGTGSGNGGDTYSFGAAGGADRALGGLRSGSLNPTIGASFTNETGATLTSLIIGYTGEHWRLGTANRADRLDFQYSLDGTIWIDVDALDFSSPTIEGMAGLRDGNAAANQTNLSQTIGGLSIPAGATFFIRWSDVDASGADDGLAIDNFSITPIAGPVVPSLTVNDVTVAEGQAGNTDAVFTVTLSAAATETVTVSFTTADGSATAGSDYALTSGTLTFAPGETSKQVVIPVNGDLVIEGNETFTLVLSGATGATIADASGTGTITNDDVPAVRPGTLSIDSVSAVEGDAGTTPLTFTVTRDNGTDGAVSATYTLTYGTANASDFAAGPPMTGQVNFAAGQTSATITLQVSGDLVVESNETFTVTLSSPTGGATLGTAAGTGTIRNDDVPPLNEGVFINELHYDNAGTDTGEAIEIAAAAGTDLTGWSLVLYSLSDGATLAMTYNSRLLSGVVENLDDGYGTLSFSYPSNGIQNGAFDGVALVDPFGRVVQFLSYEGQIKAGNGPAAGLTSQDIGVSETNANLGFSLQLTGEGASYADFTWADAKANTFGAVNSGQDFLGGNATGAVRVEHAQVVEGNDGTRALEFVVRRAGGLAQTASVDYQIALGTADAADLAGGQSLAGSVTFAPGASSVKIVLQIAGDTIGERNESVSVTLSNPVGNIVITDGAAKGVILNDDLLTLRIFEIQGESHRSEFVNQEVVTSGVVTALRSNGFFLQDATGDGNARTSDGLFVATSGAPTVAVGDGVQVRGIVGEVRAGTAATNLTNTQMLAVEILVQSSGNAAPAAVLIGTGGVLPPTDTIEDDNFTSFDPATDGIDFYESLEGMRVTVDAPQVVANASGSGVQVVASLGAGVTGLNSRGGVTISDGDFNPERIELFGSDKLQVPADGFTQGDQLSDATGILSYFGGAYEVLLTETVTVTKDVAPLPRETTTLTGDRNHLTLATYNLENLDPTDSAAKFNILAENIVLNLKAPDILGVQEIQDADGAGGGSNMSGFVTAQRLIDAIKALGGPNYVYVEVAPPQNTTGGEPGGNIRNGFFYNADRVGYIGGSAGIIDVAAFAGSRKPLVADFTFNGETIRLVNVHASARIGSDPLYGANQPPVNADDARRIGQSQAVADYVQAQLATNPDLHFGVLGDFNGFYFEESLTLLEKTGIFTNLHRTNAEEERYSYIFDGNAQAIDHILVSGGLKGGTTLDAVHINAEQPTSVFRGTDHDPLVARIYIRAPNEAPANLVLDDNSVDENAPAGTLVGTLQASDIDGDKLAYSLVDDAGGRFAIDRASGALTTTVPLNFEQQSTYTIVAEAIDPAGLKVTKSFTVSVADVNEGPTGLGISNTQVRENSAAGSLVGTLSAADEDGDTLSFQLLDDAGGLFILDRATGALTTSAPLNFENRSSYVIEAQAADPAGLKVTRSFTISVADVNEAPVAQSDAVAVDEDGSTANLWSQLLGNDSDPDAGALLTIASVDTTGLRGELVFDAASKSLVYLANDDSFDALPPGATFVDSFSYTVTDQNGLTSQATVAITVTGIADGIWRDGGNGNDTLTGTGGEDLLLGGNGNDVLRGLDGHDRLEGGNGTDTLAGGVGNDTLLGGAGNDQLFGGAGRDTFHFARGGGSDTIGDFELGVDKIVLGQGIGVKGSQVGDFNGDGIKDLSVAFTNGGGSVVLLGVTNFAALDIVGADGFGGGSNAKVDGGGYEQNMMFY